MMISHHQPKPDISFATKTGHVDVLLTLFYVICTSSESDYVLTGVTQRGCRSDQ
jgi:hypothetical protein